MNHSLPPANLIAEEEHWRDEDRVFLNHVHVWRRDIDGLLSQLDRIAGALHQCDEGLCRYARLLAGESENLKRHELAMAATLYFPTQKRGKSAPEYGTLSSADQQEHDYEQQMHSMLVRVHEEIRVRHARITDLVEQLHSAVHAERASLSGED